MKAFKGADFIKRTSSIDAVGNLHSELQACLADVPGASSAQDQLSDQRVVCDRVLRACNHWAGDSSCHGEHLQSLVPLAQLACRGFHASGPQRTPFYLEKILFHLMKNFSARESSFWACTQFSDLLYSFLISSPADQQDLGDFTALSKSGFQLIWKAASDKEQKQSPCSYNRETLCLRLHSLRFLLLLECSASHGDSSLSVSRHTKSATLAFESKGKLCSQDDALFLSQTLEDLLVKPLVQHGIHSGPRARCLVELTLERCHKLCKSRCFKQGREAIQKAHEYLNGVEGCCQVGLALLDLALDFNELDRPFELGKLFSKGTDLVKAAFDSGDGWLCQALGECCQFAVSSLDGRLKHSVNAGKLGLHEVLSLAKFLEMHSCLIEKQASMISKDATRQLRILKQQQCSGFQNFTSAVCSFLQRCKDTGCDGLELLLDSCKHAISRVLSFLETLPDEDVTEFLNITASCVHNLAYWFYSQKRYQEASDLVSPLCERLAMKGCGPDPELAVERLHRCFRLHVESCRKAGQNALGLAAVAHWLRALRAQVTKQMAEPIALWVRVKMDGVKNGDEELRLRTLKDELTQQPFDPELMVSLLAEELKGYKSVHSDTGQERYNTICDLLELCSEGSNLHHYRPPFLLELAQVLCYHDYREQTDCSALDAVEECLRLLESTSAELNNPLLLDTKAQALLWWYICTLEAKLQEGLEVQQRKAKYDTQQPWTGVEYEPNDLNYEDKLHDDLSVRDGICFTLAEEAGPMKSLDEALALWKCILSGPEIPSLSSTEQTVFSLQLLGSLYRLMGKPLKSIESFQLACHLSHFLRDNIREAGALCQLTRLLFYLNSPQHAQITLQEAERILQSADRTNESYTLYELSCQLLHSQLYRSTDQFKEGVELLLGLLQHPALQKSSKAWYLLKVQVLQELSAFLSLPSACLLPDLQKQLYTYGWHNPETALTDAHKLLRSIVLLLLGNEVLSSPKGSSEVRFVDNGENLLQKWQVLADLLSCSQDLVSTLCRMGSVSEAKSFCFEGLKVAKSLQSIRHCADFLVRKAELETLRSETQLCEDDLQYVVFLMESCTDFTAKSQQKEVKVKKISKGKMSTTKAKIADTPPSPPKEDFIKGMALQYVDTRNTLIAPDSPSSVPYPEKTLPHFISHTLDCTCPLCSDLMLSLLCTRWLVAQAENDSQSYGLLSLALQRCQSISQRFSEILQKLFFKEDSKPVALGVADELVARVYLAMSSLSPPTKLLDETLENGLSFLSSRQDSFPKHWKAGLLLAKTMKFIYKLASKYGGSVADLFVQLWSWQPQFGSKNDNNKSRAPSKSAFGKKVFLTTPTDLQAPVCLVGSVDTPIISSRPQTTPNQKYRPSTQSRPVIPTLTTKSTVMVYNEESPVPTVQPRAPRGRKTRTVLKVVFSDSDLDVPDDPDDISAPNCKKNTARAKSGGQRRNACRANLMQTARDSEDEESKDKSRPRRGRPSTKKAPEERDSPVSQRRSRRVKMEAACEEVEVLRAIIEEPEEILNLSIDELRGSDTEEKNVNKAHQKVQKPLRKDKTVTVCDVLRRDVGVEQGNWTNGIKERAIDLNPFSITGLSSPMTATLSSLNLHSVSSLLHEALESVSHFPPCVLYSRLCHLLALFTGDKDPYNTALLVSESVSVTLRHHLLSDIHRKMRKLRKEGTGDMCDRFQRLTISDNKDPRIQYLVELEELFHFPAQAFDTERFKEQLKRMPANTVACVLTLADSQLGSPGDTLLLTRLEKDNPPVTVQIPTAHLKVSLSAALHEFEEIQKQQKAINNLTDKKEWWDGRMGLDGRMKALIGLLEEHILGCWKVLMMPPCLDPAVSEEANKLLELSECDWGKVNSTLMKTVLGGSHHLTPQLISSLIQGFNLSQPERAQELLQKAVERLKSSTSNTKGHLVLILDKHLQKLPWESTPCLLLRSVTRLPSLHFLLSYNLRTKYQPQSTLVQGVDPKQTFYVLNPHSNLPGTEERFREWFQNEPGWKGVIRSPPKSEQLQYAITKQDLYIYVGHGAGAHFLDVQTLQRLDCNAVVLLFGCSSAALAVRGDLEGAGIVLKYLLAGCPLVLGNLWDVTDREIDRYTVAFLQGWLKAGPGAPLLKFLSESRQAPKLKYIIGAAPVAYGLPVNLQ